MQVPDLRLDGRVVLVTGASSGLGAHFARLIAAAGASLAVGARRSDRVAELAAAIEAGGGKVLPVELDVTDRGSVDRAVAATEEGLGPIDVLVSNAGIARPQPFLDMTEEAWSSVLDTDLSGVWRMGQAVGRVMAARRRGSIVNIASILGFAVQRDQANYAVAKAGVIQLTRIMALELGRVGVRVNALAPGYVATEINAEFFSSERGAAYVERLFPKRLGQASELDAALLLLASDAGSFINGAVIPVDGGTLLKGL